MDACISETPSLSQPRWLRLAFALTIGIGLLWRLVRYLGQFPIWGDEAMLLLNILDRDYPGLTQHLDYSQVAPLLFLWLEKTALLTFGSAEWAIHLFPFLAGTGAFLLFWRTCNREFSPAIASLAVGILAVSYYPIRHACEVKPYAFDLLYSIVFASLTLTYPRHAQTRWLIGLIVVAPVAVFSSYPSVFVGGAVSLVLLPQMRTASWLHRFLYACFNLILVASFLGHYGLVAHSQIDAAEAQRTREFLRQYWKDAFPPDDWLRWPMWLLRIHTGNMLAYPFGSNHGGSTLTFLFVLAGSVSLWRTQQRSLLALCWLPFALNLCAAILNKYPFGDSARITLHLAPFICILAAHGIAAVIAWLRSPAWQSRFHLAVYLVLIGCGSVMLVRDVRKPYKTEHDQETRRVIRELARQTTPGEPVWVCHVNERGVLAELAWYLRTEPIALHWLGNNPFGPEATSCWVLQCSHHEPTVPPVVSLLGEQARGWRITQADVRLIPPENNKMQAVYCWTARLVRE